MTILSNRYKLPVLCGLMAISSSLGGVSVRRLRGFSESASAAVKMFDPEGLADTGSVSEQSCTGEEKVNSIGGCKCFQSKEFLQNWCQREYGFTGCLRPLFITMKNDMGEAIELDSFEKRWGRLYVLDNGKTVEVPAGEEPGVQKSIFGKVPNGSDFCFIATAKDMLSHPEGYLKMKTSGSGEPFNIYYSRWGSLKDDAQVLVYPTSKESPVEWESVSATPTESPQTVDSSQTLQVAGPLSRDSTSLLDEEVSFFQPISDGQCAPYCHAGRVMIHTPSPARIRPKKIEFEETAGYWNMVRSHQGGNLEFTYTVSVTQTSSSTTTQLQEWSAGIKQSFKFLGAEVTGSYKEAVTRSITDTVTSTESKAFKTTCTALPDGRPVALWQWVVAARQTGDARPEVESWPYQAASQNTRCGPADPEPRCPLNKCDPSDIDCQKCLPF
uniref:Uncharacterized protein n=1 Tax=Chromera velia CCMP2878 TaxID=1169474 RepID=A0A0G4FNJ7_9ALVE|eukprot:Cvel_17719.t1-p1 / transcript=Cvel_17719.t1 / gene=Cvel_17719 / organism=Chromera_velia_CCMP2878 / gene_product=hypothetical protein / transcript_product=hypothetical protein / location=Cvel_scaffold1430:41890-43376(-) / protein_length=440 / sequence_SO=supercontig / SO=protein_coding / is_pseudo=false